MTGHGVGTFDVGLVGDGERLLGLGNKYELAGLISVC